MQTAVAERAPPAQGPADEKEEKQEKRTREPSPKPFTLEPGRLWPRTAHGNEVNLGVVGFTGEYNAGKTIAAMSIAPGLHPAGHPFAGKPRTRIYDLEKSSTSFGGFGADRVDLPDLVTRAFTDKTGVVKPYGAVDILNCLVADLEAVRPGQFDVIAVDPVNDIESGIVEMIRKSPEKFGLTSDQVRKGGGLLWGAVKDWYKAALLRLLASRCQTFVFTTHMRDEFRGAVPTGRREPKGKETLAELAGLYVRLEREPISEGPRAGTLPEKPAGVVLKCRLVDTWFEDGELKTSELLPPRIPVFTIPHLRGYIASGFIAAKARPDERVVEKPISEAELLRLRASAAEAETTAAIAKAETMTRVEQLRRQAEASVRVVNPQAEMVASQLAKVADRPVEPVAPEQVAPVPIQETVAAAQTAKPDVAKTAPSHNEPKAAPTDNPKAASPAAAPVQSAAPQPSAPQPAAGDGKVTDPAHREALQALLAASTVLWPETPARVAGLTELLSARGKQHPKNLTVDETHHVLDQVKIQQHAATLWPDEVTRQQKLGGLLGKINKTKVAELAADEAKLLELSLSKAVAKAGIRS